MSRGKYHEKFNSLSLFRERVRVRVNTPKKKCRTAIKGQRFLLAPLFDKEGLGEISQHTRKEKFL